MKHVIFILFFCCTVTWARAPKDLSISRTTISLQTEGIEFKSFKDMTTKPIPPLQGPYANIGKGSNAKKVQVYKHQELWLRDNHIATYSNSVVTLDFYKMNYIPDPAIQKFWKQYVDPAAYKSQARPVDPSKEENMLKWLKELKKTNCQLEERHKNLNYNIKIKSVISRSDNAWDFSLVSKDNRAFFISMKFRGAENDDILRAVKTFMRYIKINPPKEFKKSTFQSSKFKPSNNASDEYNATINEVKQQVLNTKGWWFAQTDNYVLKSNLPTKKRTFAKNVQKHVEFIRSVYEKFIPPIDEIKAVSIITIPSTKEEYLSYTNAPSWSAGVWMSYRKELAVSSYTSNEANLMKVLRHEAFHQYIFYALNENRSPAWFNEGHADLFSAIKQSGSRVTLIEDMYHLRRLTPLFERGAVNIKKHIYLNHTGFYNDKDLNYPLAWSIIYFLRKGAPLYKDKRYANVLSRALTAIGENANNKTVTDRAFEGIDLDMFQKDFLEFWTSKSMRSKAKRNYIVPR